MNTVQDLIDAALRLVGEESTYGYDTSEWIQWLNDAQHFIPHVLEPELLLFSALIKTANVSTPDFSKVNQYDNTTIFGYSLINLDGLFVKLVSVQRTTLPIYFELIPLASVSDYFVGTHRIDRFHPICWIDTDTLWISEGGINDVDPLNFTASIKYISQPVADYTSVGQSSNFANSRAANQLQPLYAAIKAKQKNMDYGEAEKLTNELFQKITLLNASVNNSQIELTRDAFTKTIGGAA